MASMKFDTPLTTGTLIKRYKRFLADIRLSDGSIITAHVPNTGSMMSTNEPDSPVAISYHPEPHRKLKWTLELIYADNCWVGVNTSRTNKIVQHAVLNNKIKPLTGYDNLRAEVKYGKNSRIDLLLTKNKSRCYVEIKNVTYKENRLALFPDAITARGAKHLEELMDMVRQGHRAIIFFLVNRNDCTAWSPARHIDPHYGETLDRALKIGVEAMAYRVSNTLSDCVIDKNIPIRL